MTESVGKNCECIYAFEKHYVEVALAEWIGRQKEQISNTKKNLEEMEKKEQELGFMGESLKANMPMLENLVKEVEAVKERFAAMPTC